jgi:lipoate-protein ligase A
VLPLLDLWIDPAARDGPENMAVDEWLAETRDRPVLRSYRWQSGWGSCGYFVRTADLPEWPVRWVRRWTGGGIVDHRTDWTYTLFVPKGFGLAAAKGGESYRIIHQALVVALRASGVDARLSGGMPAAAGGECFRRPVEHDVLDRAGRKIAGAGQRRTVLGLLHQGSVAAGCAVPAELAQALAEAVVPRELAPDPACLARKVAERYSAGGWTARR